MKIKDVEKQVGISKANIRFYEEEGLIHPARNQENNYREYSEADVEQLQEIKKLRLIGIPVQEIKEIYEDRLTLQEALSRRLDEIEKEERTLKETKLTCQKALKSKLDITSIDQLEIEEEKEEWQVRLAILLKEDIVQKKLSRIQKRQSQSKIKNILALSGSSIAFAMIMIFLLFGSRLVSGSKSDDFYEKLTAITDLYYQEDFQNGSSKVKKKICEQADRRLRKLRKYCTYRLTPKARI